MPLDRPGERVTKKPFGIFIEPKSSPVQPERFRGYHTGTDYEIFPDEQSTGVSVRAVCDGKIVMKRRASGYGGVVVQACTPENQPVTVVYGHVALSTVTIDAGQNLKRGETLGLLGAGMSTDTDGERKHLHLGIHRGPRVDIRGYVASKADLSGWIDACSLFCQ